jgi:hypothetical protein
MEERVSREGGGFDDTLGAYIQAMVNLCEHETKTFGIKPDPHQACYTVTAAITLKGQGVDIDKFLPSGLAAGAFRRAIAADCDVKEQQVIISEEESVAEVDFEGDQGIEINFEVAGLDEELARRVHQRIQRIYSGGDAHLGSNETISFEHQLSLHVNENAAEEADKIDLLVDVEASVRGAAPAQAEMAHSVASGNVGKGTGVQLTADPVVGSKAAILRPGFGYSTGEQLKILDPVASTTGG